MRKQKLHFDNLQAVLDSSPTTLKKGTQQFETPQPQAEALCMPLTPCRPFIFDPQCGHGALLRAAAITSRGTSHHLLGVDIDPTASIPDFPSQFQAARSVIHGDFTKVFPMLRTVKARFDLIVANPPFSLKWELEPMHWQTLGNRVELAPSATPEPPATVDSTLYTFEAIHAMLTKIGEGMMICNAATADRLLAPHPLYRRTWLRLDLPNFFSGVLRKMNITVLYFAANHKGDDPLTLTAPDTTPDTIRRVLEYPTKNRDSLIKGDTVRRATDSFPHISAFDAVQEEWRRLTDAQFASMHGWNIRLSTQGTIHTNLTPFQRLSGDVPKNLVEALSNIQGKHPTALVVQRTSRKALSLAVNGNIWRVHPDVTIAVDEAMRAYNAVRAPLRPLNRVQRLGHLDEEDAIKCERPPCYGFTAGRSYALESEIVEGRKIENREHWRRKGEKERVLVTGQELLLRIKDDGGHWHAFTQYPMGSAQEKERPETFFHMLSELVDCFEIPEVPDVAELHPAEFRMYQERLLALESS